MCKENGSNIFEREAGTIFQKVEFETIEEAKSYLDSLEMNHNK